MFTGFLLFCRGKQRHKKRYWTQLALGYVGPLVIVLLTIIVDHTADKCSALKPDIGLEACFFSDQTTTFFWFHLPLAIILIFNTVIFAAVATSIMKMDANQRDMGLRTGKRSEQMDRFLMYLKLFVGMGMIWTFEIIAGICGDFVHDRVW